MIDTKSGMDFIIMIDTKYEMDFAWLPFYRPVGWWNGDVLMLRPHLRLASFGEENTHRTLYKTKYVYLCTKIQTGVLLMPRA